MKIYLQIFNTVLLQEILAIKFIIYEHNLEVDLVYLDFIRAFDLVPRKKLI